MEKPYLSKRSEIRREGLRNLCEQLGIKLEVVLEKYNGEHFSNSSINKIDYFKNVINSNLTTEQAQFVESRCSFTYHKDNRQSLDYGLDLAFGWLAEDVVLVKLSDLNFEVQWNSSDRYREYLSEVLISTQADYKIHTRNGLASIELVMSWEKYWKKTNRLDLRDSKFKVLSEKENAIIIGIEPMSKSFFICPMSDIAKHFEWRKNPAWGNKGVYTLNAIDKVIKPLSLFNQDYLVKYLN